MTVILWRSLARHHSILRLPVPSPSKVALRLHSSTAATGAFTSFFWRNDQWSTAENPRILARNTASLALRDDVSSLPRNDIAHDAAALPQPQSYPPLPSATVYRRESALTLPKLVSVYFELSKARLSFLMVLSTMSSVALSPLPTTVPVLLATALGTGLCSAAANAFNQIQEVPYDAQMARTRNRPLVRHAITPLHATGFGVATSIAGPAILWTCVNPTTALLGAGNILLYSGLYTYLKRKSIANTWVGAVVGAIPPVMGWTACGGQLFPSVDYPIHLFFPFSDLPAMLADNPLSPLALGLFLYLWQFPHFNSLSFFVRDSYARAGYKMLSVFSPSKNATVSLRHAIACVPLCSLLIPFSGLTDWSFALTSVVPNYFIVRHAFDFWRTGGNSEKAARKLFLTSLWYLPVVLGLMMIHKNGLWQKWFGAEQGRNESR